MGRNRSSRSQMFFKIGVLKNFAIFTGKHLCWGLFFNRVPFRKGLQAFNFIKKETPTQLFSCEYCEILKNTSGSCFWVYFARKQICTSIGADCFWREPCVGWAKASFVSALKMAFYSFPKFVSHQTHIALKVKQNVYSSYI